MVVLVRQGEGADAAWGERVFRDAEVIESPELAGPELAVLELWQGREAAQREARPVMATARIRIGPADAGRAMTLEELREADEEPGYLDELARGVLEVTEVPRDAHGQIVHNLHTLVFHHCSDTPA